MKITKATDFAIRLLAHLAAGKKATTSQALAEELGIPLNHLAKLVQTLARRGFLLTRKGRGGGLSLAVDPGRVNLAEVIEAVEGPIVINDCLLNRNRCRFSLRCKARRCLDGVRLKIQAMLAETTVADVALQY